MKQSTFSPYLRFLFVVFVLSGILMISFSFIPFEVWSQTLNAMTRDGKLESFTFARFQVLSTFMRLSGFCLILCFTAILTRPQKAIVIIESGRSLFKRFRESIRKDAKIFFIENLPGLRNRKENFVILLLVFMAFVVRLANLFMPMDHDEAYNYNAFASYPLWHVLSDYHVPNNHVLLTIMVNILTRLLGNHLWVIRMPTFIIGVCMVPAGYWLARRLYDKESAVLSAIFIAFFPVLVVYSVLARGYAIISLLTLLTFLVGDYVRNKRNFFAWIILIVLSALGFYAVPVMLLPFGALYIWLFYRAFLATSPPTAQKWNF